MNVVLMAKVPVEAITDENDFAFAGIRGSKKSGKDSAS
jgi:hypothetical protein